MTTPTLLEAARALAMARERYAYLLNSAPGTVASAVELAYAKAKAYKDLESAMDALDAAYRAEEYGDPTQSDSAQSAEQES